MKKFRSILLLIAVMLICAMPTSALFVFPGLSGFPSVVSGGDIWIIAGILTIAVLAAVVIIKKAKSGKDEK